MEVFQRTNQQIATRPLRRGCSLLLFALVTVVLSASAASSYDLAVGYRYTCVIDDNGVTCWGRNSDGQSTVPEDLIFTACSDGIDNDGFCDMPTSTCTEPGVTPGDPWCDAGWDDSEATWHRGLGFELALLLPPLMWLRGRRLRRLA
jgi:hypothetical protein